MDGSEGQRFLHARSANEIENNDEHWLWDQVDRIKRSIESVLGHDNEHRSKRMKRGLFDWIGGDESENEVETTEASTTESPTTKAFDWLDPLGWNSDEKATTVPPREDHYHQNDGSPEEETTNQEDLDLDSAEGSGSSRDYDPTDTFSQYCELHILDFKLSVSYTNFIIYEINHFTSEKIFYLDRLRFKLNEVWSPEYEDENSAIFKEKCKTIAGKIEELYDHHRTSYNNRINARVTEIR